MAPSSPVQGAEFGMREELILKTAVLAERFYPDLEWYVDSMLTLIERAGDLATKDIWHSTVQIITNYPALHEYAARKVRPQCPPCPDAGRAFCLAFTAASGVRHILAPVLQVPHCLSSCEAPQVTGSHHPFFLRRRGAQDSSRQKYSLSS